MTINVFGSTNIFMFLFYAIIFLMSLDYIWSGYRVIRDRTYKLIYPKLLGYWIVSRSQISDKDPKLNNLYYRLFYSIPNIGFWMMIGGFLTLLGSLLALYSVIFE